MAGVSRRVGRPRLPQLQQQPPLAPQLRRKLLCREAAKLARSAIEVERPELPVPRFAANEISCRGLRRAATPFIKRVERDHRNERLVTAELIFLHRLPRCPDLVGEADPLHRRGPGYSNPRSGGGG